MHSHNNNRAALGFILRFIAVYIILTTGYHFYLKRYEAQQPDGITAMVAKHCVLTGKLMGINLHTEPHKEEASFKVFHNDKYVARVVEGCNSISVIILFWAFIIAFKGKWIHTIGFGFIGSGLIYGVNILRITLLTLLVSRYPEQVDVLHRVVFPGLIYGFVFLLWIIWVKYFAVNE